MDYRRIHRAACRFAHLYKKNTRQFSYNIRTPTWGPGNHDNKGNKK